jgi:hypothetical protein
MTVSTRSALNRITIYWGRDGFIAYGQDDQEQAINQRYDSVEQVRAIFAKCDFVGFGSKNKYNRRGQMFDKTEYVHFAHLDPGTGKLWDIAFEAKALIAMQLGLARRNVKSEGNLPAFEDDVVLEALA